MLERLTTVRRTGPISASVLGLGTSCLLRLVLDGDRSRSPPLPPSPTAILGRMIHEALSDSDRSTYDALRELRGKLLAGEYRVASVATETGEVPLRDAVGVSRMMDRIPRAAEPPKAAGHEGEPSEGSEKIMPHGQEVARLTEHALVSRDGELRGRLDLLECWHDGSARVTDFKTGGIWSAPGVPQTSYRLQVAAYGCLVLEGRLASDVRVRLIGTDGAWEQRLTRQDREEVENLVGRIVRQAPRDTDLDAQSLATFGSACRWCRYRPVCGTYLDAAPKAWCGDELDHRLPYDTWGTIVRITEETDDLVRLHLEDAAGRLVCIFGVPERLFPDPAPGDSVAFFTLRPLSWSSGLEHPRNFRIVWDRPEQTAHDALVITEREVDRNRVM